MRGEGLDKLEVLMSLGAILSNVPEVSRFMNQNRMEDKGKKGGNWLIKLIETLTSKDDALLEQSTSLMKDLKKRSLVRDLIVRMGSLDKRNNSSFVTSLAARLHLMENPSEEHTVAPTPAAPSGQQKGGKAKGVSAAPPTIVKKISKAHTAESAQVDYLNSLAEDIQALIDGPPIMTSDQAIDQTIERLELRGMISSDSLKKKLEEAKEQLKELNPELLYTITEAMYVLSKAERDDIMRTLRGESFTRHPGFTKKREAERAAYIEEELGERLKRAMEQKTGLDLPKEQREVNRKARTKELARIPDQYRILYGIMAAVAVVAFIAFAIWSNYHP